MGSFIDQDGILADEDYDYHEPRRRYIVRCVCDPTGRNMPGVCPGPHNCPYSGINDNDEDPDE